MVLKVELVWVSGVSCQRDTLENTQFERQRWSLMTVLYLSVCGLPVTVVMLY
jgi:hypothetical protein